MSGFQVIRIGEHPDDPVSWMAADASGARQGSAASGTLEEATAGSADLDIIVLVPSSDVLTTSIDIPVKGGARLAAALPFALEEFLADDVDDLHFASATRRSNGQIPVSVVNRKLMASWLERLADVGISPVFVVADSYGLARIPGTISLMVAHDRVFINDGEDIELVMEGVSPGDALAAIGALDDGVATDDDNESPQLAKSRHVLVYCDVDDEERYQHDWIAIRHEMDSLDVKLLPDGAMPRLAVTVASGAGVNLLQGEFARKTEYSGLLQPWKYAALLLLGLAVTGVGAKAASYYSLTQQAAELNEQFQSEYQQLFPGASEVLDPRAAVSSARARVGGRGSDAPPVFLMSMQQLGLALKENEEARIEAVSYRAGVVDVRISAPDVATLDRIQRSISEGGQFTAAIQSTDQGDAGVNSRIQIKESGA
jgi:general secretion pathway protein L